MSHGFIQTWYTSETFLSCGIASQRNQYTAWLQTSRCLNVFFAAQSKIWFCIIHRFTVLGKIIIGKATLKLNWEIVTKSCHPFRGLQLISHTNTTYTISEVFCLRPLFPFLLSYPISVLEYSLSCCRDVFRRKFEIKFKDSSDVYYSPSAILRRQLDIFCD